MPLITALHLGQHHKTGRLGRLGQVGYAVNVIGLGLFGGAAFTLNLAVFFLPAGVATTLAAPTRVALLGSAAVFVIGVILFAIAMVRAGVYPKVPAVAYGVAFPLFAGAAPLPDTPLTSALHVLVGATLIWLSAGVVRHARR
jgi:hypothetical protein